MPNKCCDSDLSGLTIQDATLIDARIITPSIEGGTINNAILSDCDYSGETLTDVTIENGKIENPEITGGTITNTTLVDVTISGDFSFDGTTIENTTIENGTISGGVIDGAKLSGVQIGYDCDGAPIIVGFCEEDDMPDLATCADLKNLEDRIDGGSGVSLTGCDGTALVSGAAVVRCDEQVVVDALAYDTTTQVLTLTQTNGGSTKTVTIPSGGTGISLVDCKGDAIGSGSAVASCVDLNDAVNAVPTVTALAFDDPTRVLTLTMSDASTYTATISGGGSGGLSLVNCAGTAIANGDAVPLCSEMTAAITTVVTNFNTAIEEVTIDSMTFNNTTRVLTLTMADGTTTFTATIPGGGSGGVSLNSCAGDPLGDGDAVVLCSEFNGLADTYITNNISTITTNVFTTAIAETATAPTTTVGDEVTTVVYGARGARLGGPTAWLDVKVGTDTYTIPAFRKA